MTKVKISLSFFVLIVFTAGYFLLFQSCKKDSCSAVTCSGKGTPDKDCICACNTGYEGTTCETETRTKFLGVYNFSETCNPSGSYSYLIVIDTSSVAINKINIFNLYNQGLMVSATISGTSITIASQPFFVGTISGTGSLNANTISLTYTFSDGINTDNCSGTGTK